MKTRKLILLLIALMLGTTLSGCLNPVSVDNYGYVVAIGADLGKEKKYELTLELQRESSGEATDNNGGSVILSCEAEDLFDAVDELSRSLPYKLNFTRTHIFIFGEELAEKGMITDFLSIAFDTLRIRRSAMMIVSTAPVRDYIGGLASNNTANVAKMQDALISAVESTGEIAAMNVSLFYEGIGEGRFDPVMPLGFYDENIITDTKQHDAASKGENPIEDAKERVGGLMSLTEGVALFDGERMVGTLDPHDTQFMNLVRGDFKSGNIKCEVEGKTLEVFTVLSKRKIKVGLDGEARVKLRLNVTVRRDPDRVISGDGDTEKLKAYFESEIERVFKKCRLLGCDAMGLGRYASMNFYNTDEFEAFSWKKVYSSIGIQLEVEPILDDKYLTEQ